MQVKIWVMYWVGIIGQKYGLKFGFAVKVNDWLIKKKTLNFFLDINFDAIMWLFI
jgi:hypothetical protein